MLITFAITNGIIGFADYENRYWYAKSRNAIQMGVAQLISRQGDENMLDKIALALIIIGAVNWGSIGLFQYDLVAALFGGQGAMLSRIIYTLVALSGVWAVSFFFRDSKVSASHQ